MGVSQTILRQLMEIIMDRLKGKMQNHIEIYGKPLSSKSSNRNWGDPCAFSLHAILEWNTVWKHGKPALDLYGRRVLDLPR
jgi:hypothetical protein